jgi:hypothetical protein
VRIFIRGPSDGLYLEWHLVNNAVAAPARCKPTILAAIDAYAARGPERKSSADHASYAGTTPGVRIGCGIVAGVLDLFVLFHGIAHMVEIKTPTGELSDPQQSVMAAVLASGGRVGVVRDADEMLGLLDAWGIPRAQCLVLVAE